MAESDFWLRLRLPFDLCRANQMDRIDTHTHTHTHTRLFGLYARTQWRATRYISPLDLSTCQLYTNPILSFYFFAAGISYRLKVRALYYTLTLFGRPIKREKQ